MKLSLLEEDTRDIRQYLQHAPVRSDQEKEEVLDWLEQQGSAEKEASKADELQLSLERQELQRIMENITSETIQQGETP